MRPEIIEDICENEIEKVNEILKEVDNEEGNIIFLLQKLQESYGYLPPNILFYISQKLKISPAEIFSIATFYKQFKLTTRGKNVIVCCSGTACHIKGAPLILTFIENFLGIKSGEVTKDKFFSLEAVACLGCCAISPVCIINGEIYGNLSLNKLRIILNKMKKETYPEF